MLARSNKGIALIAMTLSIGGLVLMRAPKSAGGGEPGIAIGTGISNKASTFFGPGLRGELTLSHGNVLARPGFELYADLKLTADKSAQAVRAPLAIAIVLDNSGSMQGEKLDEAKRSIARFIGDMQDNDEVSFTKYSDSAMVLQPLRRVGDVRSALLDRVRSLQAEGGTNIPSGLRAGRDTLTEASQGRVKRIVLVSDGLDSTRVEAERLAGDAAERGVVTSSLGIGLDFDEMYMSSVAHRGHGNFAFVKDGATLGTFLKQELTETASTVVENTKIRITLPAGVRFVRATGADASVSGNELTLSAGTLFSGEERRVLLEFATDLEKGANRELAARASWDKVGGKHTDVDAAPLAFAATDDNSKVTASLDQTVNVRAVSIRASNRQVAAAEAMARGDEAQAFGLINQNTVELRAMASAAPPSLAKPMMKQAEAYDSDLSGYKVGGSAAKAAAKGAVARESAFGKK
jgi:Ca-activated chloride channel homolog